MTPPFTITAQNVRRWFRRKARRHHQPYDAIAAVWTRLLSCGGPPSDRAGRQRHSFASHGRPRRPRILRISLTAPLGVFEGNKRRAVRRARVRQSGDLTASSLNLLDMLKALPTIG